MDSVIAEGCNRTARNHGIEHGRFRVTRQCFEVVIFVACNLNSGPMPTVASNPVLLPPGSPDRVPSEEKDGRESTNDNDAAIAGNWQIFGELAVQSRDKPPTGVRIGAEDVSLSPYKDWTGFFVGFAKWLVESGKLVAANCPVHLHENSKMHLVSENPIHPSSRAFDSTEEIGAGLWIEKNLDTPGKKRSLIYLLKHCGVDPVTVLVKID